MAKRRSSSLVERGLARFEDHPKLDRADRAHPRPGTLRAPAETSPPPTLADTFDRPLNESPMTRRFVLLIALPPCWPAAPPGPCHHRQRRTRPLAGSGRPRTGPDQLDTGRQGGTAHPNESTSANLDWRHTPNYYRLLISGPFGAGRSTLEGTAEKVTLTTGEGRVSADKRRGAA